MSASAESIQASTPNRVGQAADGVGQARLRRIEASLLVALARQVGRPMSREELCRQVWKCEYRRTTRTIDQTVATLRKKLPDPARIVTVFGVGYSYLAKNPG